MNHCKNHPRRPLSSQGFASSYAGRIFVLDAPKVTLKKGELDDYSFTLDAFGYTLPRFAA